MNDLGTWEDDCPALHVCEAIGNARRGCCAGESKTPGPRIPIDVCIVSLILLTARGQGINSEPEIDS